MIQPFDSNFGFNFLNNVFNMLADSADQNKDVKVATEAIPSNYSHVDKDKGATIVVELPGVPKEAISCTFEGNNFKLSAPRDVFGQKLTYTLDFTVREEFDCEKAELAYKDGLLTISIPNKVSSEPRKLTIA